MKNSLSIKFAFPKIGFLFGSWLMAYTGRPRDFGKGFNCNDDSGDREKLFDEVSWVLGICSNYLAFYLFALIFLMLLLVHCSIFFFSACVICM